MPITSSFHARSTAIEVVTGHDLSGKTVLLTGANSGIGFETARALLSAHAEVIMAVRDRAKGETAAKALQETNPDIQIHILALNLSSLASVRQAAEQFLARWTKLDLLINNAGIMATPLGYTVDGFEQQFATNYLGHYLLTCLLLPALQKAAPARIVSLTSRAHQLSDIHFDDIQYQHRPYNKWEAYGQAKTADALLAVALTRHFSSQGITANAVSPGSIRTGLQQNLTYEEMRTLWDGMTKRATSSRSLKRLSRVHQQLYGPVSDSELEGIGGLYLADCNESLPVEPGAQDNKGYMPYALNPDHAEQLWTLSQNLVEQ